MNVIFSLHPMRVLLAILSFALALPAQAVRLESWAANNQYIGVANYAFSYTSTPLVLSGYCAIPEETEENTSSWVTIPSSCDTSTNGTCWADTCTGTECRFAEGRGLNFDAIISVGSMRKGLLQYYADNHNDPGQGYCNFSIGTWLFSINFNYEGTGEDFSLALYAEAYVDGVLTIVSNSNGWTTSGDCPWVPPVYGQTSDFTAISGSDSANINNAYNLICNKDFVVSLAADPSISHGAMISVANTQGSLSSGSQEVFSNAAVASQQAFNGSSSAEQGLGKGVSRTASPLNASNQSIAASASATEGLRRLSNQTADDRRWLVTSDAEGKEMRGALLSGPSPYTTDLVACQLSGDDGNLDPVQRSYSYDCDLASLDGTSNRKEVITVPGSVLRPGLLQAPLAEGRATKVRATNRAVPSRLNAVIRDFAKGARLASPDGSKNLVWHGIGTTSRVVMVKRELEDIVEVVTHSPDALTPMFMSCSGANEGRALNPVYACTANLRCTGSPCPSASWSTVSNLTLPLALFKNRPCQPSNGVVAEAPFLQVSNPTTPGPSYLTFRSTLVFPSGSVVRPDQTGFRLLVQDANGHTVVDADVPATPGGGRGPMNTWKIDGGGERFTFQSSSFRGALRPKVTIERGDGRDEWLVSVSGGTLSDLNDLGLNFPLTASLTLQPADQNSGLCTATEFASASN